MIVIEIARAMAKAKAIVIARQIAEVSNAAIGSAPCRTSSFASSPILHVDRQG